VLLIGAGAFDAWPIGASIGGGADGADGGGGACTVSLMLFPLLPR
jgi:hypothetical protein